MTTTIHKVILHKTHSIRARRLRTCAYTGRTPGSLGGFVPPMDSLGRLAPPDARDNWDDEGDEDEE